MRGSTPGQSAVQSSTTIELYTQSLAALRVAAHKKVLSVNLEQAYTRFASFNGTESGTEWLKTGWRKRG
jgi:hypothetical protein